MGKRIAGFLGVLASIAGILGLFVALNVIHPFSDANPPTPIPALASDTCISGYVWREAFANDHVCVTPDIRTRAQYDNSQAQGRIVS